jgi:Mlc titration factor MtfA (ptsG expression regulator)
VLRLLVHSVRWEGCGGLEITDEVKVTIAGQAALLLLGIEENSFRRVETILVYPSTFVAPARRCTSYLVAHDAPLLGEAWSHGAVVIAWDAVLDSGRGTRPGRNLVLHEFAHQLDLLDGWADGMPWLAGRTPSGRWRAVMKAEYEAFARATRERRSDVLAAYAATNRAEFFAVATEAFFEQPAELASRHARLYELLQGYFMQDPRRWFAGPLESRLEKG